MKKSILIASLAAAGMALGSNPVLADGAQPWHVTGQVGGVNLQDSRDTRNNDVMWGVGFGRFFGNNFSLDFEYDEFKGTYRGYNTAVPGATYDKWGLSNWGAYGRYYFGDSMFRPYVVGGIGAQKHRSVLDEDTNMSLSYGIGVQAQLAKHWSIRAQGMFRRDLDGKSIPVHSRYVDFYYSIGLSFDFGGSEPPPPPPPPPPPAKAAPPPNPDLDGDGVPNERDKCPNTRPGAVVDLDGCEVEAVIELGGVNFDFDKATLKPEAIVVLNKAAALLQQHERVVVEVAGHTDSKGTDAYNQKLSERRAIAVKDYLNSKGVKASRLTAKGYGESMPIASNDTDAGRAENRRVELIVLDR